MHPAPHCLGDQAPHLRSVCGRFTVYRTEGRERGARGAAPFTRYSLFDAETGRITKLSKLVEIDCLIHFRLTGEQTAPYYLGAHKPAPKVAMTQL